MTGLRRRPAGGASFGKVATEVSGRAMRYPIEIDDGGTWVIFPDGSRRDLRMHGRSVTRGSGEWQAVEFFPGTEDLSFLHLQHRNGIKAVHYYSKTLEFIAPSFDSLPAKFRRQLVELSLADLSAIWNDVVCRDGAASLRLSSDFLAIAPCAREQLAQALYPVLHRAAHCVVLAEENAASLVRGDTRAETFREILDLDLGAVQSAALDSGSLTIAVSGFSAVSTCGVALHTNGLTLTFAHRFIRRETGQVFFLIVSDWNTTIHAIFIPDQELTIYSTTEQRRRLEAAMRRPPERAMFEQVAKNADLIREYFSVGSREYALFYYYSHIGHHLWNELTGLHRTLDALRASPPPRVYVVNAQKSEIYGRLDDLFPEISETTSRFAATLFELPEMLYSERICYLHITSDYISRDLRQRIIGYARGVADLQPELTRIDQYRAAGFRIVVLGLRVENRTLVDLAGFFISAVEGLSRHLKNIVVVVDGHNTTRSGSSYASLGESGDRSPTAEAEHHVLDALSSHFATTAAVKIVSTIGKTVAMSIVWCDSADFYITPWGAGLASAIPSLRRGK